ncbi:MAG: hypothetical protein ACI8XW_003947, partial [Gammaproteobacteria bacterium]
AHQNNKQNQNNGAAGFKNFAGEIGGYYFTHDKFYPMQDTLAIVS